MTDDRSAFTEARDAGLRARHETREARAIRRQVAEEIATAIETFLEDPHPPGGPCQACDLTHQLASVARRIGGEETKSRLCQPGCEFVAPHPSHPCGQYTRERP